MTRALILATLALALAEPASAKPQAHFSAGTFARLGQTVRLGNLRVTPLAVIEDSRCPRLVTCVWRGRLRISAAVDGHKLTLDNGVPMAVAKGRLTLVGADPLSQRGETIPPPAYRFELRFER
jgi:hypothetical protein